MDTDNKSDDTEKRLQEESRQQQTAADLIRGKLDTLYGTEPDATEELAEVTALPQMELSVHQRYMQELSDSGRGLAEIQTAWHEYYGGLSDSQKHEVWQEFYSEHARATKQAASRVDVAPQSQGGVVAATSGNLNPVATKVTSTKTKRSKVKAIVGSNAAKLRDKQRALVAQTDMSTANEVRNHLVKNIQKRAEVRKNPHVKALAFGLSMGSLTLFVLLFGFFNERFVTPFIRPNTNVSATPIIVDPDASGAVGTEAKIIIPKINVEAPVVYDVPSITEADVQKGLEGGVVHYPTTPKPGEKGNAVIFGHSSSNILNKGKYKFAFILLKSLEKEDTFIVEKDGKRYVYKVYNKFVTTPQDISVLGQTDKPATVTLVTCDPPGTSTNRLIIQAEQIFPDPSINTESSVQPAAPDASQPPQQLPSNSTTMWQRVQNLF